ncbi:hypothetical protein [Paenibacillus sanguinis]|uniref:hypothetical protein n=1 Tax=Paenibacillus sanguinis TaxID=225906 RepID=UPI000374F109|nr:hypothetical protein [Paenibacillus sanguinis]
MFEGFLEMQSAVTRIHGRLGLDGEHEYRKIEFGNEHRLPAPDLDRPPLFLEEEQPWWTRVSGKWRSH